MFEGFSMDEVQRAFLSLFSTPIKFSEKAEKALILEEFALGEDDE